MANSATVTIEGLSDLEDMLNELDVITQRKVLRKAARNAMQPVLQQTKQQVSSRWGELSGALEASVLIKTSAPKNKGWADLVASVGIFDVASWKEVANLYYPGGYIGAPTAAYWFEYGVQPHSLTKKARAEQGPSESNRTGRNSRLQDSGRMHPGITAKPVLRPVMDANIDIVNARVSNILGAELDRVLKKGKTNAK